MTETKLTWSDVRVGIDAVWRVRRPYQHVNPIRDVIMENARNHPNCPTWCVMDHRDVRNWETAEATGAIVHAGLVTVIAEKAEVSVERLDIIRSDNSAKRQHGSWPVCVHGAPTVHVNEIDGAMDEMEAIDLAVAILDAVRLIAPGVDCGMAAAARDAVLSLKMPF